MWENFKDFISQLRESGESRKRRYLFGGSAVTMTLIVLLWVTYLNANVQGISYSNTADSADNISGSDFFSVMKRGTGLLYAEIASLVATGMNQKQEIIISAGDGAATDVKSTNNFQSGELLPIVPQDIR